MVVQRMKRTRNMSYAELEIVMTRARTFVREGYIMDKFAASELIRAPVTRHALWTMICRRSQPKVDLAMACCENLQCPYVAFIRALAEELVAYDV
jgi:hypothetical protein